MSHYAKYTTEIINPNKQLLEQTQQILQKEIPEAQWLYLHVASGGKLVIEGDTDRMNVRQVASQFQQLYQALATEIALTQRGYQVNTVKNETGNYVVTGVIQ